MAVTQYKNKQTAYQKKLLDPRWQKKRLDILNRDEFTCQGCGDDKKTLHVHHRIYSPGKDPWDISDRYLVTLCCDCHECETEAIKNMKEDLLTSFAHAGILAKHLDGLVTEIPYIDTSLHLPEVIISAIGFAISDSKRLQVLLDNYIEYLKNNGENPF